MQIRDYIKIIILSLCLFPFSTDGNAGEKTSNRLSIGAGWAQIGIRDKGISPLYYNGGHSFITSGINRERDSVINKLEAYFLYGTVTPSNSTGISISEMSSLKGGITYSHLRYAGNLISGKGDLLIGGIFDSKIAIYEHNQLTNSARSNYFLSTLSISSMLSYPLTFKEKELRFAFQLNLPLLAFLVRPAYAYIRPEGFLNHNTGGFQSILNSIEVSSLNRFFGLCSEFSLSYTFRNNNSLKIGYRWEYFGHNDINQLKSATHGIVLQTFFNF